MVFKDRSKQLANQKRLADGYRLMVLRAYGNRCSCCGFDDVLKKIRFNSKWRPDGWGMLEIDHIDGYKGDFRSGKRSGDSSSGNLRRKLINDGFPSGYRVLCAACNKVMEPGCVVCILHQWEEPFLSALREFLGPSKTKLKFVSLDDV